MQHETRCQIRLLAACSCLTTNTRSCCELPSAPGPRPLQRRLLLPPTSFLSHHHHHQQRHCCCLVAALHIIDSKLSTLPELSEAAVNGRSRWQGAAGREGGVLSHLAITSVWTWPLPAIKWHTLSRNAFVCCPESEIYAILDTSCVPKGI